MLCGHTQGMSLRNFLHLIPFGTVVLIIPQATFTCPGGAVAAAVLKYDGIATLALNIGNCITEQCTLYLILPPRFQVVFMSAFHCNFLCGERAFLVRSWELGVTGYGIVPLTTL